MHVPSYQCARRPMPIAAALLLMLAGLAGIARAVEFDEKLKAPKVGSGTELRPKLDNYVALMKRIGAASPLDVVNDTASLRERFDARWLLGRMVDARVPLPELKDLGFEPAENGGYVIDSRQHPEWRPFDENLTLLANPQVLDGFSPELIARGFRQSDIDTIRQYVDTHDLARAKAKEKYAIVLGASKVAKKMQKIKRPFDDDAMLSYFYQKAFGSAAVDHQWAAGLLTSLDLQRQRILASYMQEQNGTWFIGPTSTTDAIKYERNLLLRPDSEQFIKAAFEEGRL